VVIADFGLLILIVRFEKYFDIVHILKTAVSKKSMLLHGDNKKYI